MLDIKYILENKEKVIKNLNKRGSGFDEKIEKLIKYDKNRRDIIKENNKLKHEKNKQSKLIGEYKREGKDAKHVIKKVKEISNRISKLDSELTEIKDKIKNLLYNIPNIPEDDVPAGDKENNIELRKYKEKPDYDFEMQDHITLSKKLKLIDYKRGAKLGGSGFWVYKDMGAKLEWALLNFFINFHMNSDYEFLLPPHLLNEKCGYTAGQFPKFEDSVFVIDNSTMKDSKQFLIPTAETAIVNYHRDEIIPGKELPKKYFSYTPCYRREAGSYRAEERGMIRGHQFNKVEMFQLTKEKNSDKALEELVERAETLMKKLNLHYRVTKLAAKDVSFPMSKTYDIEVWIPSMNIYKEVSSASNAKSYQANRGKIRYKDEETNKNKLVHTLNASGLATSRLLPALIEQNQNKDGSITIPEVLRKYLGGKELIK